MSTEEKKTEVARGLSIRKFAGSITDKDKKGTDGKPLIVANFSYDRAVFPWSRTGKDINDKEVTGSVPSLSEVLAYCQSSGMTTEFVLDKTTNEPVNVCVVSLLVDGLNAHLNRTARAKAENTPDSAKAKAVAVYAKMLGISTEEAEKQLFGK